MPFDPNPPMNLQATLVDIDDIEVPGEIDGNTGEITKKPVYKDVAIAIFSDKSQLKFPKGVKFVPDNHTESPTSDRVVAMRMRASVYVDGQVAPVVSLLIPLHAPKQFVIDCIKRLEQRV